jgi:hypothetical protein
MAHVFKYAILMAVPNPRRGERVNVGLVVFLKDRLDVRITDAAKIGALAGGDWKSYMKDVSARLLSFESGEAAETAFRLADRKIDPIVVSSDFASFSIEGLDQYEERVKEILDTLVVRPKLEQKRGETRINTEISQQFRTAKILAKGSESIDDHRVVRDFYISEDEELIADFAVKNGAMHVTATLDLRKSNARIDEAALKAVTLDKAKIKFGKNSGGVKRYGVYAAADTEQCAPHIRLLRDYSDAMFNWSDREQRANYIRLITKAAAAPFEFGAPSNSRRR